MSPVQASENLRVLRRAAGLSQEALAVRCGISERTIRTLEAGRARRPHRDTLVALAEALGLPSAAWDEFVASWRGSSIGLKDLVAGQGAQEVLTAEFVRQRSLISELSIHESVSIDRERQWVSSSVRRTFEVTGEGLDRFLWLRGYLPHLTDPARFDVVDCRNVEIDSVVDIPEWSARAWEGRLGRALSVGEVYSMQWTYDWASAAIAGATGPVDTEAITAVPRSLRALSIEVVFASGCLPSAAWYVVQDSITSPQHRVRPLEVSPFGVVQLHLEPASAGAHGVRWDWD